MHPDVETGVATIPFSGSCHSRRRLSGSRDRRRRLQGRQGSASDVKRSDAAKGFQVLPKRWIVERTFGWLVRCRRLAKDFENLTPLQNRVRQAGNAPPTDAANCKKLQKLTKCPDRL
jgi:transposase